MGIHATRTALACGAAIIGMMLPAAAMAQQRTFNLPRQSASKSIPEFARQAGIHIVAPGRKLERITTPRLIGSYDVRAALKLLIAGSDLRVVADSGSTITLAAAQGRERVERPGREVGEVTDAAASLGEATRSGGESQSDDIVVTGTQLRNVEPLTRPQTITSDRMRAQGYNRLDQVFEQLPQNFNGISQDATSGSGAGGDSGQNVNFASGIDLRGLGASATLVLLNGRRVTAGSFGTSVDISSIPISAIERVEVLTDGASAVYGSDAVSGVVNIITKRRFEGAEIGARITGISEGRSPNYGGNLLVGTEWSSGGVMFNYDYEKDNRLLASARSFQRDTPSPTYLYPEREISSLYGSLHQSIGGARLNVDVLYSYRRFESFITDPFRGLQEASGYARQFNANVELNVNVGTRWNLMMAGQYSRQPEQLTTSYSAFNITDTTRSLYSTPSAEIRLDGPLFHMPGGDVRLAVGGQIRRETFSRPPELNRTVKSSYSEVLIPLVGAENALAALRQLQFSFAGRYDDYSDFGDTFNPKFSVLWKPVDSLAISGSYGRSFHAPSLDMLDPERRFAYLYPSTDPSQPTGTRTALLLDGSNPSLQPERATSYKLTASFEPASVPSLNLQASFFSIKYRNRIISLIQEGYFDQVFVNPANFGFLVELNPTASRVQELLTGIPANQIFDYIGGVQPADIRGIAFLGRANSGQSRMHGIDGSANYAFETGIGQITTQLDFTYIIRYRQSLTPQLPEVSILNTIYHPLRFRGKLNFGWSNSQGFAINSRLNYANSYEDTAGVGISSWATFDLSLSYTAPEQTSGLGRGLRISLDIGNLFNRNPPYAPSPRGVFLNYDPTNANALKRTVALTVSRRF